MNPNGYPYSEGNLLEQRNTYMYAKYGGQPFLNAWRMSREQAQSELPTPIAPPSSSLESTKTDALLEHLYTAFSSRSVDTTAERGLEQILQRFEITKRIHAAYDASFRAVDRSDYHDLRRYVRFAEVLDAAYSAYAGLPRLNTLLKCLDTLVAMRAELDADHAARLAWLIDREWNHVRSLAASKGVAL